MGKVPSTELVRNRGMNGGRAGGRSEQVKGPTCPTGQVPAPPGPDPAALQAPLLGEMMHNT